VPEEEELAQLVKIAKKQTDMYDQGVKSFHPTCSQAAQDLFATTAEIIPQEAMLRTKPSHWLRYPIVAIYLLVIGLEGLLRLLHNGIARFLR
jgi:hypothetical protein